MCIGRSPPAQLTGELDDFVDLTFCYDDVSFRPGCGEEDLAVYHHLSDGPLSQAGDQI